MPTSTGILAMVMDHDQTGSTPAKDRMRYKRGDIVEIMPPGQAYMVPPAAPFYLFDVTGVPMTVPEIKARYEQMEYDANGEPYRRRIYWVDLDSLPTTNKNDLAAQRFTQIAWNKAKSSIKNKVTGQPEV